tara:strand:+ start:213 stop:533 length:321 start_codon:yes stop_codon:yes gene_type:complete
VELVEKKLSELEAEKSELNNATQRVAELGQQLKSIVSESVSAANNTGSVDEKLNSLVGGLQNVLTTFNDFQIKLLQSLAKLDNKINVLEEVLEEYIESPVDDLPQE